MDAGRDYAHWGLVYPFRDRPDISQRVLWYPVPLDLPNIIPPNPFVLRNWDRLEGLPQTELGTDQYAVEYYYGPLPINTPGVPCGTDDEWANGLLYSTYLAGGYQCGCPTPTMPPYVSSFASPDGSLTVDHPTGDVHAVVNLTHGNHWLVTQEFQAGDNAHVPIIVHVLAGHSVNWFEIQNAGNVAQVRFTPPSASIYCPPLELTDAAGTRTVLLSDSSFLMNHNGIGQVFALTIAALTRMDFGSMWNRPSTGLFFVGSKVGIGRALYAGTPGTLPAELYVDMTGHTADVAFAVLGDLGSGPVEVCTIDGTGNAYLAGFLLVGGTPPGTTAGVFCRAIAGSDVIFQGIQNADTMQDYLMLDDSTGSRIFGIAADGRILTNQAEPGFTTLGTVVGRMAIRDSSDTIIGYVPLYDSIT